MKHKLTVGLIGLGLALLVPHNSLWPRRATCNRRSKRRKKRYTMVTIRIMPHHLFSTLKTRFMTRCVRKRRNQTVILKAASAI